VRYFPSFGARSSRLAACRAQALYDYSPGSESEGALEAGRTYDIIDRSDNDWWRIEAGGCVRMVPAAYLEVESGGP
jgi:hypothetical protein